MNFVKIAVTALFTLLLSIGSTAMAGPADGTYTGELQMGSYSFDAQVHMRGGVPSLSSNDVAGFTAGPARKAGKRWKIDIRHKFTRCSGTASGTVTLDTNGSTPVFKNYNGKCSGGGKWNKGQTQVTTLMGS